MPASRAGVVDMVPVDYVISAIWELSGGPILSGLLPLGCGPEGSTTIGEALDQAAAFSRPQAAVCTHRDIRGATFARYSTCSSVASDDKRSTPDGSTCPI